MQEILPTSCLKDEQAAKLTALCSKVSLALIQIFQEEHQRLTLLWSPVLNFCLYLLKMLSSPP